MRYTHNLKLIRHRKHTLKISILISVVLVLLIIFLGFTELDAASFFGGFLESLTRVFLAYLVALALAIILTFLATINRRVESILVPILDVLQSFPSFALFPLFVVWFGKSSIVTIFILIITMVWPILFTILSAQKQLHTDLLEAATIFGAKKIKLLRYVLLPLLLPSIVTGSIVGWGEAWEAIIAAEIIINVPGVGTYLAKSASESSQLLVIGIFLLLTILYLLNKYTWLPLLNLTTKYIQE